MDYEVFLGYELELVEEILKGKNVVYKLILVTDPKNTILGCEKRVIKIDEESDGLKIYYSLF